MERCLVTGADGFIGSALCRRLDQIGVRVYRLVREGSGLDTLAADLGRDPILGLGEIRPEVVFHLAARVHVPDLGSNAEAEHMRVTVEGTRQLLHAAVEARVRAFVFFSSCAVMPEGCSEELDERTQPSPTTLYGRAKLFAEELVLSMNGKEGMSTVCLRLPMVYGPGHKGNLPLMIRAIERGIFPPLPALPGQRSLVHVDDAVDAALLVANEPEAAGKVYLVAEPRAYSSREIYDVVLQAMGRRPPRWRVPYGFLAAGARVGDLGSRLTGRRLPFDSDVLAKLSRSARFSSARIHRELGFTTSRSFTATASDLVPQPAAR